MIHHASNGSACWISSIVQLPNFYPVNSVLKGFNVQRTYDGDVEMTFPIYANRDIRILPGLNKYKIEFRCNDDIYDIVGLSDAVFTIQDLYVKRFLEYRFYPIYMHAGTQCYLFTESINALFRDFPAFIATPSNISPIVTTPIDIIKTVADYNCIDLALQIEQRDICNVRRDDSISTIISMSLGGCCMPGFNDGTLAAYNIPIARLPPGAYLVSKVRQVADLTWFLSPYGSVPSDIAAVCFQMSSKFNEIATMLQSRNVLPYESAEINYCADEDGSFAGRWIAGVFAQPYSDFEVELKSGVDAIADLYAKRIHVYDDFKTSFDRFSNSSRDLLMYLPACFDLGTVNRTLLAQRTWLEDITIRDIITKDIILYVDIVWWVLACAEGLINKVNIDQLTG